LPCMKVNADIYCLHSASSQSPVKESRKFTTRGGRRLLHNITTNLPSIPAWMGVRLTAMINWSR
jgi:hypothetical protein